MINVEIQRQRKAASKTYEVIKERDQLHLLQRADDIFKSGGLYPTFIRKNLVQIFYDVNRLDQRLLFAIPIAQKHRDSELQEFCQAMIADYTRNCIKDSFSDSRAQFNWNHGRFIHSCIGRNEKRCGKAGWQDII